MSDDISFKMLSPYAVILLHADYKVLNWRSGYLTLENDEPREVIRAAIQYYMSVLAMVGEDSFGALNRSEHRILFELGLPDERDLFHEVLVECFAALS
jgi:hypothetical protein